MKKLALFSLMVCAFGLYGFQSEAGTCGSDRLALDGTQKPGHDEFLYTSKQARDKAMQDYENDKNARDDMKNSNAMYNLKPSSYVLECDKESCSNMSVAYVANTGYSDGNSGKFFQCEAKTFDDKWTPLKEIECGDKDIVELEHVFYANDNGVTDRGKSNNEEYYYVVNQFAVCKCSGNKHFEKSKSSAFYGKCVSDTPDAPVTPVTPGTPNDQCTYNGIKYNVGDLMDTKSCSEIPSNRTKARTGKTCELYCMKRSVDVKKPFGAYSLDHVWMVKDCENSNYSLVPFDTEYGNNRSDAEYNHWTTKVRGYQMCKKTGNDPVDPIVKSCKDSRSTPEGKACCDIPANKAKWENNQCKCLVAGEEFKIVNGKGQCVAKDDDNNEELSDCYIQLTMDIKCADGINGLYSNEIYRLSKEQVAQIGTCPSRIISGNVDANSIMSSYIDSLAADQKALKLLLDEVCTKTQILPVLPVVPSGPSAKEIESAKNLLSNFKNSATSNASGWKTADGKFNTTRLASDISAGVVLGTVGGVVSGVVIKKKQVEKGFEALHCTVGGQTVAGWGDTFSVGLQK